MNNNINELLSTVVQNDYCVGCGICASVEGSPLKMGLDDNGKYIPTINTDQNNNINDVDVLSTCPFSNNSKNESEISTQLYSRIKGIKYNENIGYYIKSYAGYVKEGDFREKGSSGGMGTWIATQLLKKNLVDGIIHVKEAGKNQENILFNYSISNSIQELTKGAKSKYYPIEMSEVIDFIRKNKGKYALIGIPCFIKSLRLLADNDKVVNERIIFTIGLVCGHLKTDMFAKSMAWQMGIKPKQLVGIDFRMKLEGENASNYGVKAIGVDEGKEIIKSSPTNELYTTDWGHGFFKYKACDFCDDVLAETADITIGDAWLPEYIKDSQGTNVIVVRNQIILDLMEENQSELQLNEINESEVYESQSGGFRHRKQGLSYRLYLKDQNNEWRPIKRVEASDSLSTKRKKIYKKRITLYEESFKAYKKAEKNEDFNIFIKHMDPIIKDYNKLINKPFLFRAIGKVKRMILK
ncbi:Coenzyme F420 hydrogenase/dehydrogenase, beta subunit C-terminal domain [Bacillus timonensis]|nr:Coenzyme F420 hydrogenase/dehydrogenase, beta subunit C-terminal domain [Bacillus timonensis]